VKNTKAHLAVLGTNLFFAANYSLVKYISPALVKPFALNVLRVGGSLVLFWLLWLFSKNKAPIKKQHISRFLLCGLTGVAINQMLFLKGLTLTSTIHASLLILTTPLLISIFALWVLKEALTIYKVAGLVLGISGSVLLVLQKESGAHATNYLLGDLFIFINAISYTLYFILVKTLMEQYSPLQVIRWVFTFGLLMILPFGWSEAAAIDWNAFTYPHLAALAAIVLTGTFLAYVFNAYGIQRLGAGITGSYIYTQPVFAVLIATLILSEALTLHKLIAALFIFSGVYLVTLKKKG
jgi:drug/metabolite transporter (DMT)-like permease